MIPHGRRAIPVQPLVALFLLLVTVLHFGRAGGFSFVNFDDPSYVAANPHVATGLTAANLRWAFTSFHEANWHPLTWLSHMADVELFGLAPRGHHWVNILLHGANGVLLFLLLARLTGRTARSATVALLFLLHPLHVETVAWVAERKELLCTTFSFLTLIAYARYTARSGAGRYCFALGAFACALMAKPMAVTIPCVLLLLDFWPLGRTGALPLSRLVGEKVPFFLLTAASCVVTYLAQEQGGAVGTIFPFAVRTANAATAYAFYLGKALWPEGLAVIYPFTPDIPPWRVGAALLLLVALTVVALRFRRRSPWLAVGWLWYLGTLVPVIGLVQVGLQAAADRYTYLPLTGIFIAAVWGAADLAAGRSKALAAVACGVLLVLSAVTWRQLGYWRDSITLFSHAVAVTDKNFLAHNNLATALYNEERFTEAIEHYTLALEGNHPLKAQIAQNLANARAARREKGEVYFRRGLAFAAAGDERAAVDLFRQALAIDPENPFSHYNLAVALERQGRLGEALRHYGEALRLRPGYREARENLDACRRRLAEEWGR